MRAYSPAAGDIASAGLTIATLILVITLIAVLA
jgi:hypothetical protein